jgi:diguanylate cyclase (GGDEF)-like protein
MDHARDDLAAFIDSLEGSCAELGVLLQAARSVLQHQDFETTARAIFTEARRFTGATAGYVALLSDDGADNEVQFLEPGGTECTVDRDLPMPIRGLRAEAYRTGRTVVENRFQASAHSGLLPAGHVHLRNVMFAPLVIEGAALGVMGLSNKPTDFTPRDEDMASAFADIAALALWRSRGRDLLLTTIRNLDTRNRQLEQANLLIQRLMNTDPLTRVHTRAYFQDMLEQNLSLAQRHGLPLCLAMVDLDHFKRINDRHGHDAGDEVLRQFGALLRTRTRREDVVGRYGGEEFQILMPNVPLTEAVCCALRLRAEQEALTYERVEETVTASFGVVEARPDESAEELEKRADEALYEAKDAGRNRVIGH